MTVTATQTRRIFADVPAAHTIGDAAAVLLDEGGEFLVIREESTGWAIRECSIEDAAVGADGAETVSQASPRDAQADPPTDCGAFLGTPLRVISVTACLAALLMSFGIAWTAWGVRGLGAVTGFVSLVWALMRLAERWRDR